MPSAMVEDMEKYQPKLPAGHGMKTRRLGDLGENNYKAAVGPSETHESKGQEWAIGRSWSFHGRLMSLPRPPHGLPVEFLRPSHSHFIVPSLPSHGHRMQVTGRYTPLQVSPAEDRPMAFPRMPRGQLICGTVPWSSDGTP